MPNWVPFISLCILSILLLIYTLYKNQQDTSKILLFWLFISGLAYVFEFFVFVVFNSYAYHPHILSNRYNDSVLGSISSQAFSVPITITFITACKLKVRWIILIIGFFIFIETWFLHLQIYSHFWWETLYTPFFLILSVILAKAWWELLDGTSHYVHFITLFFALSTIILSLGWVISPLLGVYEIHLNIFPKEMRDVIAGNSLYLWFSTYLYTLVIFFRSKGAWIILLTVSLLLFIEIFMYKEGILETENLFTFMGLPLFHLLMMSFGCYIFNRHFQTYLISKRKGLFQE